MTTDGRESCMFISDGLSYLPFILPTDKVLESYPKVPLTPAGEWKPLDLDDYSQWDDSDYNASVDAKFSSTSYTQTDDVLKFILSYPDHKAPRVTFSNDVVFTKGSAYNEFFFDVPELDTRKFDNYYGLSTSPVVCPFGPTCIYATTHHLISIS